MSQLARLFLDAKFAALLSDRWDVQFNNIMLIFLLFCVFLLCVFTFGVPCCDVLQYFCINMIFGSSLHLVVCIRAHVLFTLFVFVCA